MWPVTMFHELFAYHHGIIERLWESIRELPEEKFLQEVPYSHGSLRNQMVHMAATEKRWLLGIHEHPEARTLRFPPDAYPTIDSVHSLVSGVHQELQSYISTITEGELQRVPSGMYGPVWQVLLHLINHGTDHRAQILRILHELGGKTFDQDLLLYIWRRRRNA
jgi:uncharacterized damage-inducible protein DinB